MKSGIPDLCLKLRQLILPLKIKDFLGKLKNNPSQKKNEIGFIDFKNQSLDLNCHLIKIVHFFHFEFVDIAHCFSSIGSEDINHFMMY